MIEFKTVKGEFVVKSMLGLPLCTSSSVKMFDFQTNIHIINGLKYECLCKLSEATEEDATNIVDILMVKSSSLECDCADMLYRDYTCNKIGFKSDLESLHSLLTSKGIDINNGNWYLFKKI